MFLQKEKNLLYNLYSFSLRATPPGAAFQYFMTREQQAGVMPLGPRGETIACVIYWTGPGVYNPCPFYVIKQPLIGGETDFISGETIYEKLEYNKSRADHQITNRLKDGGKKF